MKPLVYLASPYSHPDPSVRKARWQAANEGCSILMRRGLFVYAPIATAHIAEEFELPTDAAYWYAHNRAFIECSHTMVILKIDGWDKSKGVLGEIALAEKLGISCEDLYLEFRK